jgi:hypothetical protein
MNKGEPEILFEFSPGLDTAFLRELYGDDLQQAEVIFESSLKQLKSEIMVAESRFHDGDVSGLKKVVHKMKPLFGYVGLGNMQEAFSAFEEDCARAQSPEEIVRGFGQLMDDTEKALQIIEAELKRLVQYNTQFL